MNMDTETGEIKIDYARRAKLYAKMARVMGEISRIRKDAQHPQGWRFASASAVMDELRAHMSSAGLAIQVSIAHLEVLGAEGENWLVTYSFTLLDSETGETMTSVWYQEVPRFGYRRDGQRYFDDKSLPKAHTTALKYFLLKVFLVSTDDDPDADKNEDMPAPRITTPIPPAPPAFDPTAPYRQSMAAGHKIAELALEQLRALNISVYASAKDVAAAAKALNLPDGTTFNALIFALAQHAQVNEPEAPATPAAPKKAG